MYIVNKIALWIPNIPNCPSLLHLISKIVFVSKYDLGLFIDPQFFPGPDDLLDNYGICVVLNKKDFSKTVQFSDITIMNMPAKLTVFAKTNLIPKKKIKRLTLKTYQIPPDDLLIDNVDIAPPPSPAITKKKSTRKPAATATATAGATAKAVAVTANKKISN